MPRLQTRRLTADQFSAIAPLLTTMGAPQLEAARRVLVDGEIRRVVAADHGCSHQAVSQLVDRVWDAAQAWRGTPGLPPGWEVVELAVPAEVAQRWRDEQRRLRATLPIPAQRAAVAPKKKARGMAPG